MVRLLVMFVVIIVIVGLVVWLFLDRMGRRPRTRTLAPDDDPEFLRSLSAPGPSAKKPEDGDQSGTPGA